MKEHIREIPITSQDQLWFIQKQISLFDFLDFFPPDSIATPDKEGTLLTIETDLGWSFQTDIEAGKFCFRKKATSSKGTGMWVKDANLTVCDKVVLEKLSDYHYKLYKL